MEWSEAPLSDRTGGNQHPRIAEARPGPRLACPTRASPSRGRAPCASGPVEERGCRRPPRCQQRPRQVLTG
eukprot:11193700-Lingulodinium_polyedra.AAC.1